MLDSSTTAIVTLAVATYAFYRLFVSGGASKPRLPPGPAGWPFFGNVFDLPRTQTWLTFARWGSIYGPISSISVFGRPIIFLNSLKPATEMLSVKGKIYADRPELTMGGDMVGWKASLPLMREKESWQASRTMFHGSFGTHDKMRKGGYNAFEEAAMMSFLRAVVDMKAGGKEDGLDDLIKTHIGAINLGMVYGYEVKPHGDPFTHLLDRSMKEFAIVTAPGAFIVDYLPFLRHIPSWFPGGAFRSQARLWAKDLANMGTIPYVHSKEALNSGNLQKECFITTTLTPNEEPKNEGVLAWTAGSIAGAGYITRLAFVRAFFLSMALYPDIQRRAQAEIDRVVGTDRLPGFADRQNLPYVDALCREISRFHSVVPSGMAHVAMEDDVHDGYLIPKGSIVLANIWSMLNDPGMYTNPKVFNPSRFILEDGRPAEKDVFDFIFGFGRRACPGRVLAESSMYIMVAMTLSVFDIAKAVNANGKVVEPKVNQLSGSVSQPTPYECTVKPRSRSAATLIK